MSLPGHISHLGFFDNFRKDTKDTFHCDDVMDLVLLACPFLWALALLLSSLPIIFVDGFFIATTTVISCGGRQTNRRHQRRATTFRQHESINYLDAFQECWSATTVSVNPNKNVDIDVILQGLVSPAPQSYFVVQRALHRLKASANQTQADGAASSCHHLLKRGHRLLVRKQDDAFSYLPGVDWTIRPVDYDIPLGWYAGAVRHLASRYTNQQLCRTHQLAQDILDYVVIASDLQQTIELEQIDAMVHQLSQRLDLTLGTDLRGRTAADAMLTLALAGVGSTPDPLLYTKLETVVRLELERTLERKLPSQSHQVVHVVEKMAAAGALPVVNSSVAAIYQMVGTSLWTRRLYSETVASLLSSDAVSDDKTSSYDLLHDRPLLWIWRFASRLSKPTLTLQRDKDLQSSVKQRHTRRWQPTFDDESRPLVIDLGCGFGTTLLGLASLQSTITHNSINNTSILLANHVQWSDCNFLGVDLQQLGLRFASAIVERWSAASSATATERASIPSPPTRMLGPATGRLQYVWMASHDLLDQLAEQSDYSGTVALIMVQFPTPYRLVGDSESRSAGNLQLPDVESLGFLGSFQILNKIAKVLRNRNREGGGVRGRLLVQSNCEDVAVQIRNTALRIGFTAIPMEFPVLTLDEKDSTERTKRWLQGQHGGDPTIPCRALGSEWSSRPLLPPKCASETDVSCQVQHVPVHRILFEI